MLLLGFWVLLFSESKHVLDQLFFGVRSPNVLSINFFLESGVQRFLNCESGVRSPVPRCTIWWWRGLDEVLLQQRAKLHSQLLCLGVWESYIVSVRWLRIWYECDAMIEEWAFGWQRGWFYEELLMLLQNVCDFLWCCGWCWRFCAIFCHLRHHQWHMLQLMRFLEQSSHACCWHYLHRRFCCCFCLVGCCCCCCCCCCVGWCVSRQDNCSLQPVSPRLRWLGVLVELTRQHG